MAHHSNRVRKHFDQLETKKRANIPELHEAPPHNVLTRLDDGSFTREYHFTRGLVTARVLIRFGFLPALGRPGWSVFLDSISPAIPPALVADLCRVLLPHIELIQSFAGSTTWGGSAITLVEPEPTPRTN